MVWFNPYVPPQPSQPTVPRPEARIVAVTPVKEDGKRRQDRGPHDRRRRLFDGLMEEIEALPDLDAPHKDQLKQNLRDYLQREHAKPPDERLKPPPHDAHPQEHAAHIVEALAPPPAETEVPPSDQAAGRNAGADVAAAEALAGQLRRCLELNTDVARKISTYLHVLMASVHEVHLVEVDV